MTIKELVELFEERRYLPFVELYFYDVNDSTELFANFDESRITGDALFIPVYRLEEV